MTQCKSTLQNELSWILLGYYLVHPTMHLKICNFKSFVIHATYYTYLVKTNAYYVMGKLNYVGCSSYAINSVNCNNINVENCRDLFPHF